MSDLKRTLSDLADRGTPIGVDRLRDRVILDLAAGSSWIRWTRADARPPALVIAAAVVATSLVVGAVPLLFGWMGASESEVATGGSFSETQVAPPIDDDMGWLELEMSMPPVVGVDDGQTVNVTVSDVSGYANNELAGVLYSGSDLTDLDRDALGGFWSVVDGNDFTTTAVLREPGTVGEGRFPFVTDQALAVSPGTYTLVVWVDRSLGGMSRWVPVNSDGMGLFGCQTIFEVADDAQTDVVVTANLVPDGWNTNCTTGVTIPGTDAAAAVAPPIDDDM